MNDQTIIHIALTYLAVINVVTFFVYGIDDGYVGGWYNQENGLYYFDSTRLFPEDSLNEAVQFGKDNKQTSVFILSNSSEVLIDLDSIKQNHRGTVPCELRSRMPRIDDCRGLMTDFGLKVLHESNEKKHGNKETDSSRVFGRTTKPRVTAWLGN